MRKVYIFGHKKPDTDSVTSSIALSYLKNQIGIKSEPRILDKINKETEFVLNYFNMKIPEYLEDVKLQIKDLNYYKDCYVNEFYSLKKTYDYMKNKHITGVPIVDNNNKFMGILTTKMIGYELINGDFTLLNTSYDNLLNVLEAKEILRFDEEIKGKILAASFRRTTDISTLELKSDTIMIVGDRDNIIEAGVNNKIKLIIIIGNLEIKEEYLSIAKKNKVNVIRTHYDTFYTSKLIGLSNYVKNLLDDTRSICFNEKDYYDEFKDKSMKLGHNNYAVVNDQNVCLGLIRITDINKMNRKQVILVDHNESSQSVEGLDEAEILEIIDHHNIGSLTTKMPINFRNMTVGSTNTIIYSMYNENNINIPKDIAGIMLSGIISDTLKFTSPTTTEYDKYVASRLKDIAQIDIEEYSNKMFKAGTDLKGKTIEEIIQSDLKTYEIDDKVIVISQVITLNSETILEKSKDYINTLNNIKFNRGYDIILLCVTDIIKNGSHIFFDDENKYLVSSMFGFEDIEQGYFFSNCLSRKKQLVPLLMSVIK